MATLIYEPEYAGTNDATAVAGDMPTATSTRWRMADLSASG